MKTKCNILIRSVFTCRPVFYFPSQIWREKLHLQMWMSVPSIMEDVNRCAITSLVISTVPVDQAISWMKKEGTAVVRFRLTLTSN